MSNSPNFKLTDLILSLNPYELTTLGFVIGLILGKDLDYNAQQALGNFFEQIGQTLLTIGAQGQNIDEGNDIDIESAIFLLKNKIGNIEQIIADLKLL